LSLFILTSVILTDTYIRKLYIIIMYNARDANLEYVVFDDK